MVSIVMPTYNCGKYICNSIDSVISQTYSDWELIIVDDCSTDNTYELIKEYLNNYTNIHYYCLSENSGPAVARSKAIEMANGKYVAFLDSDDIWNPDKLKVQVEFMENNNIDFSATAYDQMYEDGMKNGVILYPPKKVDYNKFIRLSCPIGNLTVMYNQEKLGKFTVPNIKKRNDFALWLQILKKTDYCYGIDEILASYRIGRKGSVSNNKLELIKYHWFLYRKIENHNIFRSIFEIICWIFVKGTGFGLKKIKS